MKDKLLYIIAAFLLTVLVLISIEIRHQEDLRQIDALINENTILTAENSELRDRARWLQYTNDQRETTVELLTDLLKSTQKQEAPEVPKTNRGGERLTSLGEYTITAYCSCEICCGEYAKSRPDGKVYGAAGVELIHGVSVAGWLPLGTEIVIDGHEYVVQDRTAKWVKDKYNGRIIDIYFDDHEAAWNWGKRQKEIFTLEEGRS